MTNDSRPGDPFQRPAGPDDVTSGYPVTPPPSTPTPGPATPGAGAPGVGSPTSAWAAPSAPPTSADPFDRPRDRPMAAVPVEVPPVRRKGSSMLLNVILGLALVVAVGGVAFAVGRATAPASTATGRTGFGANGGGFGANGGGFAGRPNASGVPSNPFGAAGISIQGTVTAISADSVTLQLTSGQTVTIPIDAQTTYDQRTPATASAVTSGSTVIVQLQGGRGAFGNGNGGQGTGPNASGAPGRALGPATTITVVPPTGS